MGASVVVGSYVPDRHEFNSALSQAGWSLIDTSVQRLVYAAACPQGPGSCRDLTRSEEDLLLNRVALEVTEAAPSGLVSGYYLTDDYWTALGRLLPKVYQAIRSRDATTPTVCGFSLNLSLRGAAGATASDPLAAFAKALQNYSPRWCDSVLIYSYAPSSKVWLAASVDWKMSATLSQALAILRSRGWRPSKSPFYGTVQAFGATPPTPRPHDVRQGYRPAPDPADLLTQISAFCSQGAQAILAYAWNDGQPDRPLQLSTSPELRLALAKGYRACQRRWTNDERSKDLA